jgi:heat shock protein HslJ
MNRMYTVFGLCMLVTSLAACSARLAPGPVPSPIQPTPVPSVIPTIAPSPNPANPLAGTSWSLTELRQRNILPGTTITLIENDGRLGGNGGCNSYGGEYTLQGQQVSIKEVAATVMGCTTPEGIGTQEDTYFTTLREVVSFEITNDQLRLLNTAGEAILVYQRAQ